MNEENIPVITDREELYDKCENMEQLFDKYYLPLLDKHYSKTYKLQQENQSLKKENKILRENAKHNDKVVDKVNWKNMLLKKENKQLKDNWNKLEEFIKKSLEAIDTIQKLTGNTIENYTPRILTYKQIKNKMQELEKGCDSHV